MLYLNVSIQGHHVVLLLSNLLQINHIVRKWLERVEDIIMQIIFKICAYLFRYMVFFQTSKRCWFAYYYNLLFVVT